VRVLIIHRREEIGAFWARALEREGVETRIACSGEDAIKTLRFDPVDAVVLDLGLPGREAFEVSDFLAVRTPDLPVIVIPKAGQSVSPVIFDLVPNTRMIMSMPVQLGDLAAVISHYGPRPGVSPSRMRA
jgi:two-component system, OmpR family, response regulator